MKRKYLQMIRGLRETPDADRNWSVYMVRCGDGSLYTGVAKEVEERVAKHNSGRGAAYTRTRRPVRLLYREDGLTRSEALIREAGIKSLPKPKKEILVGKGRRPRLISPAKRAKIAK